MDVTFYGREAGGSAEDFTIVVLPDTQFYSETYPATFAAQTQWIVDNKDAMNIVYVAHEGDVVNVASSTTQWDNADAAMDLLDPAGIPYGIALGNHDEGSNYNSYFGVPRFTGKSFFGGEYPTNDMQNNYMLFSAGGMDFIVINLDYTSPDAGSLDWADALLKTHSDRRAIVVSHNIIGTGNPASYASWGQNIYDALKDNPNLFLMLCGHTSGEGQRTDVYSSNTVYSLLADYQSRSNGGDGWLRILEFSPDNDEIRVKTYSPTLGTTGTYETDADSQFILSYDMDGGAPFVNLGTDAGVTSGTNASITWPSLPEGTEHEWYVDVSDGAKTTTGPIWSFTTLANPRIVASAEGDWLWTTDFLPLTSLTISIYESDAIGATLLWSGNRTTDGDGFVLLEPPEQSLNLVPGNYIVVSDGATTKSLVLEAITMDVFDTVLNIMSGTAPAGRYVWAAAGLQPSQTGIGVTADSSGAWEADLSSVVDITEEMRPWSYAQIFDVDGDINEADPPPLQSIATAGTA